MITRIHLENWRAYRDAEIDLDYPFVFFVAPNGVGKTSLFEAARWCLLALPANRHAARAVRHGSDEAAVTVEIQLPDTSRLLVRRTLRPSGRSTFEAHHDGSELDEPAYVDLLELAWAVDRGLLDRLVFGDQPSHARDAQFPVRDHLAALIGVTPLLDAAKALERRQKETRDAVTSLAKESGVADGALQEAETILNRARTSLEEATAERDAITVQVGEAEKAVAAADAWDRYRREVEEYNSALRALLTEVGGIMEVTAGAPRRALEDARTETERNLRSARSAMASVEFRAARSITARDLLPDGTTLCPTCLRPLTETERRHALHSHDDTSTQSQTQIDRLRLETEQADRRLAAVTEFASRLDQLHEPAKPDTDDPGPDARSALAELRDKETDLVESIGRLRAELDAADRELTPARRAAGEKARLQVAAREELLLETTRGMLMSLADRYLTERVEPLIHEISLRWKRLFGSEGLTLESNGELRLQRGQLDLGLADLSGGERATAVIITRLLVAASTTKVSTIWFDEPLEHLDIRRRAAVAQTLVQAAQTGTIRQILVTTYEEAIARRLAVTASDHVQVVYADTEPID